MGNILKDMAVLLFSAGEEIEKKADEFRKDREERYEKFEKSLKDKKEQFSTAFEDEIHKAREKVSEFTEKLGFVSKREIDDLKKKIDELSQKIDTLAK